ARGREVQEDVAREERAREDEAAVAAPAGDAHPGEEDLEALPPQGLFDLGLALASRPDGEPAGGVGGADEPDIRRRASSDHGTTSGSSAGGPKGAAAASAVPIDSRRASTSVTPW